MYSKEDAKSYDTPRALFPPDLLAWVQTSQPQAWEALTKIHGAAAEAVLLDRLRKQLDERGTLEVLRFGVDMVGLKHTLKLAQFKPALAVNPDLLALYAANRLRVVRQVRTTHDDVIDLVLFLNGVAVATAEIKTDFTQEQGSGPVPVRPYAPAQGAAVGRAIAGASARCAGALRGKQQHGDDGHPAGGATHGLPVIQSG